MGPARAVLVDRLPAARQDLLPVRLGEPEGIGSGLVHVPGKGAVGVIGQVA
jgi:hypothetical protein